MLQLHQTLPTITTLNAPSGAVPGLLERGASKQASLFAKNNITTILIQNINNTMAGYQKEILPSSWSPVRAGRLYRAMEADGVTYS